MPPEIIDLSAKLESQKFVEGRAKFKVELLVLHDTVGNPKKNAADSNDLSSDELAGKVKFYTTKWFMTGNPVPSVHYFVGPEKLGAQVFRLCKEEDTAFHCVGNRGSFEGTSICNYQSIGIERYGVESDTPGPNQRAAILGLVKDIVARYDLKPDQIVSHKEIQAWDRADGVCLLEAAREMAPDEELKVNGFIIGGEILQYYRRHGLAVVGLPLTKEFKDDAGIATQVFERQVLQFFPTNQGEWRVQGLQLGREWAKSKGLLT